MSSSQTATALPAPSIPTIGGPSSPIIDNKSGGNTQPTQNAWDAIKKGKKGYKSRLFNDHKHPLTYLPAAFLHFMRLFRIGPKCDNNRVRFVTARIHRRQRIRIYFFLAAIVVLEDEWPAGQGRSRQGLSARYRERCDSRPGFPLQELQVRISTRSAWVRNRFRTWAFTFKGGEDARYKAAVIIHEIIEIAFTQMTRALPFGAIAAFW